jgi:hypothetical protein
VADFYLSIARITGAATVGHLKMMRSNDIDMALGAVGLSNGYKNVLCSYLVRHGAAPFVFKGDEKRVKAENKTYAKKFDSQKDRPSLGNELGPEEVSKLEFPPGLFNGIVCGQAVPMKAKGAHGTEEVANRVWRWAVAGSGNLHVDHLWLSRIEELLVARWSKLKPWGGKERTWYGIMKNRFGNAREAEEGAYPNVEIPTVDLTSPAKRLLQEQGLNIKVNDDAKSMFAAEEQPAADTAGQEAQQVPAVATGEPVGFSGFNTSGASSLFNTGVPVAQGIDAGASVPPAAVADPPANEPANDSSADPPANEPANDPSADAPADESPAVEPDPNVAWDSSDDEGAHKEHKEPRKGNPDELKTPAARPDPPAKPPPAAKRQRRAAPPSAPAVPFAQCALADRWETLSSDEAAAVGTNLTDPNGMGDPTLHVAKIFALEDGKYDWFIGEINTKVKQAKKHFWATFVEDGQEYRMPYFPKGYGTEWYFVRCTLFVESPSF